MAPGYRANTQSRRNNRSNVDHHDVLEGLPVRQWRREDVTVAPQATQTNTTPQNDIWAVELPHGMPKDSHLLPQHSQDLLRAFRSGAIYKRPAPVEEEEVDADIGEKPDKKEDDPTEKGFTAKAWKQIPRNQEGQPIEYLAKRRKGLVTAGAKPHPTGDVPTVTKATVRRVDASGNTYEQELVIANGEKVEGEVISQTLIPDPNAIASATELQPSPMKRKPIIKKKLKGPGRGRKKKIVPPTSIPPPMQGDVIQTVEGAIGATTQGDIKMETDNVSISAINEDTEMGDGSNAASDDDEGDEGEEGEDDEEGSQQNISPTPDKLPNVSNFPASDTDSGIDNTGLDIPRPASLERLKVEDTKSGSPLKNVVLTTSNVNSPITSPTVTSEAAGPSTISQVPTISPVLEKPQLVPALEEAPSVQSFDSAEVHHQTEIVQVSEENGDDEMLLETAEINTVTVTASTDIIPTAPASQEPQDVTVEEKADGGLTTTVDEIKAPVEEAGGSRDKDDSPDLLGNLERQLE